MAQYIQAPQYSYEPLPMEQYIELAKAQGQMFDAAQNQAYAFLQNLPILDGGLSTEGWAKDLRQKYGDRVQESIDKFVKTKDRRALSSDLMSISRELKDDQDVQINNFDALESAKMLEFMKNPENRNMVAGFTLDNSGNMFYTDPETQQQKSNFRQYERGQSTLQDIQKNYADYTTGIDIGRDAGFVKQFALNSYDETDRDLARSNVTTITGQDGKIYYETKTTRKQFTNLNEAIADELGTIVGYNLSDQAVDALRVQYETQADETVRSYRIKYGFEEGFERYKNDVYDYFFPTSQSITTSTNYQNAGTGTTTGSNQEQVEALLFSEMTFNNMQNITGKYEESDIVNTNFALDVSNKVNELIKGGQISDLNDLKDNPAYKGLWDDYQKVVNQVLAQDIVDIYDNSALGQSLMPQKEKVLEDWYGQQDRLDAMLLKDNGVTPEQIRAFQDRLIPTVKGLIFDNNLGINYEMGNLTGSLSNFLIAKAAQSGHFIVPTEEMLGQIDEYNDMETWWKALPFVAPEPGINVTMEGYEGATLMSLDEMAEAGILPKDSGLYNVMKSLYYESDPTIARFQDILNNVEDYYDDLKDTDYYQQRADLLSENTSIGSPEYTITPSAQMNATMEAVEKNLKRQLSGEPDVVNQRYFIYETGVAETGNSPGERRGTKKLNAEDEAFKTFSKNVREGNVQVNYAGIPGNDLVSPGLYITVTDKDGGTSKNYLLTPRGKESDTADSIFSWITDTRSTITQKGAETRVGAGPLMGLPGAQLNEIIEKSRQYQGIIAATPYIGNFKNRLTNNGIEITNTYIPDGAMVIQAIDDSDPNLNVRGSGEQATLDAQIYFPMVDTEGAPIKWNEYFKGNTPEQAVSLREAVSIIRSQVLTEDLSARKGEELIFNLKMLYDQRQTITGKFLMDQFNKTFDRDIDFTRGIVFNNYIDAIDFYRLDPSSGRPKPENPEEEGEDNPPRGDEEVTQPITPINTTQPEQEVVNINTESPGPTVLDSSGVDMSNVPVIQSDSLITNTDSLDTRVVVPPNVTADSLVIPESTASQVVDNLLEQDNLSETDEVVRDLLVTSPELITNPLTASIDYLGISENDPENYNIIASFYESAISDTSALASTNEKLAKNVAWCAAFVNYILNDVGVNTESVEDYQGQSLYSNVRAINFSKFGTPVYKAQDDKLGKGENFDKAMPGDIVVIKSPSGHHVGFYAGVDPNNPANILILGGNQNDEVNTSSYNSRSVLNINRVENLDKVDPKILEKISKDIKESGSTR